MAQRRNGIMAQGLRGAREKWKRGPDKMKLQDFLTEKMV